MALESATNISELVETNPLATDNIYEGDDHVRLIKSAIKATFPNIAGPVNLTHTELNSLTLDQSAELQGEVDELKLHLVPKQSVTMWSGAIGSLPVGWGLCDGTLQNGILTPDLRDKFIVGAGSNYAIDDASTEDPDFATSLINTGTTSSDGANVTVDEHILTVDEMPSHRHSATADGGSTSSNGSRFRRESGNTGELFTDYTGGGLGHDHTVTDPTHSHTVDMDTRPAWFALAYIIKLTEYVAPA